MRTLIKRFREWKQHRKDQKGQYLIIYLDREMDTQHRFRFADFMRAKKAYEFLAGIVLHTKASDMIVELFNNGHVIWHCDSRQKEKPYETQFNAKPSD